MPSVASEPSVISHQHHHVGARGRAAEVRSSDSVFALLVESADADPPSPKPPAPRDGVERAPAGRTAPADGAHADAPPSEPAEAPSTDTAPASADAKVAIEVAIQVAIQGSGGDGATDPEAGGEHTADDVEIAVVAAAVVDATAAPPAPDPQAAPLPIAPVPAQQQEGAPVDGGDGIATTTSAPAPEILIAAPQRPAPSESAADEATTTDSSPVGGQPADVPTAEGKNALEVPSGKDQAPPPPPSRPIGEPPAEIAGAARAARGEPQVKPQSQPANADEPTANESAAAAGDSTAAAPASEPADNSQAAHTQHRPHHHADLKTADDGHHQPPGTQVSETAQGAKPPSEALLALLHASDPLDGTIVPAAPAAAQAAAEQVVPIAGLAVEIAARAQAGRNHFEIRLDPPELGRIDVRLDVDRSGQVTSRLVVERAETLEYLRRDAADLERALQQAGLKTAENGLQFTLRDQGGFARRDDNASPYSARLVVADSSIAATDGQPNGYRSAWRAGGIDIRV